MGFGSMNQNFDRYFVKHNLDPMIMKTKLENPGRNQDMPYKSYTWLDMFRQVGQFLGVTSGTKSGKKSGSVWESVQSMLESLDDEPEPSDDESEQAEKKKKDKTKKKKKGQASKSAEAVQADAQKTQTPDEPDRRRSGTGTQSAVPAPGTCNAAQLRQAMLWSEILGEPMAKKRRRMRENQQYGNQCNAYRR